MNLIASADSGWGIGESGELLSRIPEDMKFFRLKTTGNVIIMGRKTLESFPESKPLKDRENIVLSRDESYAPQGVLVCHSIESVLEKIKKYSNKDIYVVGGGSIYRQFLPYCNTAYITKIHRKFVSDTGLFNFDDSKEWNLVSEGEEKKWEDISFSFLKYERNE